MTAPTSVESVAGGFSRVTAALGLRVCLMLSLAGAACSSGENTAVNAKGGAGGRGGSGGSLSGGGGSGGSSGGAGGILDAATEPPPVVLCPTAAVRTPLITDFMSCGPQSCAWGGFVDGSFSGYTASYGFATNDTSGGNWHVAGTGLTIGPGGAGFYLTFNCVADASAFAGIQFEISGNVGPTNRFTVILESSPDDADTDPGAEMTAHAMCQFPSGNQYADCANPASVVTFTPSTAPATVALTWNMFTGGKPRIVVDPAQLTGLRFVPSTAAVDPDGGAVVPYDFDVIIDNISFIPNGGGGDAGDSRGDAGDSGGDDGGGQ